MMHPVIASALVAVATWEAWRWYFARVAATLDDALALIVVVLVVAMAAAHRPRRAPVARLPLAALAALTVGRLNAHGLAVERQGTFLVWQGATVQLDAPCSGVSMLWVGLLFTLLACTLLELGAVKTILAAVVSVVLAIAGNVLRTASLFYVEAGFTAQVPSWWHEAIGLAAFALSAVVMGWVLVRLQACGRPLWAG